MSWWHDLRLGWKLLGGFAAVLIVVAADGVVAFSTVRASQGAVSWVEHTEHVITTADYALTALQDMQTAYRGFLITGDSAYLDPYTTGQQVYREQLTELEQLTADNPAQVERWRELEHQAAAWQTNVTEPGIALKRSATAASSEAVVAFVESGTRQFEGMRALFGEAINVERDLLDQRSQVQESTGSRLIMLVIVGTAGVTGIGLAIAFLLQRSIGGTVAQVAEAARVIAHQDLPALVSVVRAMADGDLTRQAVVVAQQVPVRGHDELGTLAADFNRMIDALNETDARLDAIVRTVAQQRDTLSATLEAAQDAIAIVDAEFTPLITNLRHKEWFGTSAEELRELPQDERVAVAFARIEGRDGLAAWVFELLHDAERIETRRLRFTNAPLTEADCYTAPIRSADGPAVGRVFVYHDVSREAELARMKDELVSVVSHELRTPLASLVGFAELLLTRQYAETERRKFLRIMADEGRRLTALVNDFLDLQRIESGSHQIAPSRIDLRPVLERAVAALGDDSHTPIGLEIPAGLPLVRADAHRIHQLLMNLLSNARKYSPGGGEIVVTARKINDLVEVAVKDQGLGIPHSAMQHLFGKFYRVDNPDRRGIRGTGLGLAIARQIVDAHGGRIWAESAGAGQGARFVFTLPVADATSSSGDVLVVEDDSGFARLLEAELAALGHSAIRVASAEAALEYLATGRPRMVVLDLLLPGLGGEDFLQRLRDGTSVDVPVLVVSVKDLDSSELQRLEELRIVGVLRKGPDVAPAAAQCVSRVLVNAGEMAA